MLKNIKKDMNIGVDIDGVQFPWYECFQTLVEEHTGIKNCFSQLNRYDSLHFLEEKFRLNPSIYPLLIRHLGNKFFESKRPYKGVIKGMNHLNTYFNLIIPTARAEENNPNIWYDDPITKTETWFKKFDIPYNSIHYSDDKLKIAVNTNIVQMIEDHPRHAIELASNGIKLILMDKPYNRKIHPIDEERWNFSDNHWQEAQSDLRIFRVNNFNEAVKRVLENYYLR